MSTLFIAIPLTLFVLFVLPVWLWLHYNNRSASGSLSQNEQQRLLQLTDDAKRMRERIQTLEDILDASIQTGETNNGRTRFE
nr:phage shock protein B [Raoultella sp. NCTC 9187]